MSSWDVQFRNGIYLSQIDWWLDAHHPVERSFVSHAHFDHLAPHREILCSEGTARLMRARMPAVRREHILPFGQTEQLAPDTTVTLHPAGHIYGSAQSLLAHPDHGTLLYTGDFKLRRGLSAEPCATPHADVLIMETTFGRPQYVFPPTKKILADIIAFCRAALSEDETPVLFGYSLGKSQELLSGLAAAKLPVMLHPQTHKLTQVYEELGLTFPPYREFSTAELPGHVVICPPQAAQSTFLKKIRARRTAMITGWALDPGVTFRYQCDAAFPLSDHADFPDLLRFVELVAPKRVLTLHGFAADFARTLRDRGIEAWAINQDNQLEMPLPLAGSAGGPPAPSHLTHTSNTNLLPSNSASDLLTTRYPLLATSDLSAFASTADRIRSTPAKLEKIALLRDYLASLDSDEDAALAAVYFTGRPFPQSDPRTLNIGWSLLRRAVLEVTRLNVADFRQTYLRYSDSGDTAEAMLTGRTTPEPFSLHETAAFFADLAAARGPAAKLDLFQTRLALLHPAAAKYLIKIITTDLRIGLKEGLVEEAIAAATGRPLEAVREANMLSGDLAQVVRAARRDELAGIALRIFHPLQFMLASPEPTAEAIAARLTPPIWLEEKYDGIRCQLHKQGPRVELFSRDLHRITAQFPDLARAAASLPADVILDGELLAWRDGRALPFAELQKRLGRKTGDDFFLGQEIPISFSAYDLLWLNGQSLLKSPLQTRRTALESLFTTPSVSALSPFTLHPSLLQLAPRQLAHSVSDIDAAFFASRQRGNEGLMAKDPQSPYTPGRRGLAWLKLKKAYATLDVVVVGVEYGHGKRRGVLSDYTFAIRDDATGALLTVGKAYSGLTDAEIAQYTEHFLANTLEERGRFRTVVPDVILEVAFDSIQESKRHQSGYALRFPRIARIRTDKTLADIDTLETCRRLAGPNAFAPTKTV
jgi:DNA ligase-1